MAFLTNWKTTAAGVLMILTGIAGLLGIKGGTEPGTSFAVITGGFGLIFSKDGNS